MDDLSSKLNEILSDPQAMQQIKGLSQALFASSDEAKKVQEETKPDGALSLLQGLTGQSNDNTLSMLTKLAPLLSDLNKEDDTTRLLVSLRPFLSDERKKKLDQAEKIIKMMKLLPVLKDLSIFDSLF